MQATTAPTAARARRRLEHLLQFGQAFDAEIAFDTDGLPPVPRGFRIEDLLVGTPAELEQRARRLAIVHRAMINDSLVDWHLNRRTQ